MGVSLAGTVTGLEQQIVSQAFTVTAPAPKAQFESLHMPTSLQRSAVVAGVWWLTVLTKQVYSTR